MRLFFTFFTIVLLSISISSQTTRHVPAQYPTIQLALNASQTFTVSLSPTAAGDFTGSLDLNAPGYNTSVAPSGSAVVTEGLVFQEDTVWRLEDDNYQDRMQLMDLDSIAQAILFKLTTNQAVDDNTILIFQSIQKGADVSNPSWVLEYNLIRGPIGSNGASQDSIHVLLYNLNQNGGLNPGNYLDLLRVNYRVADLPALQDSVKSSIEITHAEGFTFAGFPIDIAPSDSALEVIARNIVSSLVHGVPKLPLDYVLEQNYPNPFNPNTKIKFSIAKEGQVRLSVFNILGERVSELKNEMMKPGYYEVEFNASALASGIYLYRIKAGDFVETKKMTLLK